MRIRYVFPANGWSAVYASPVSPYVSVRGLLHWDLVARDGEDQHVGIVVDLSGPPFAADEPTDGSEFYGYFNAAQFSRGGVDADGNQLPDELQNYFSAVAEYGYALLRQREKEARHEDYATSGSG